MSKNYYHCFILIACELILRLTGKSLCFLPHLYVLLVILSVPVLKLCSCMCRNPWTSSVFSIDTSLNKNFNRIDQKAALVSW